MFVFNNWYVAAWGKEVQAEPLGRRILGKPIVLVRLDNTVVAMEDRCCHRGFPLSRGHVVGCHLQCGYHGLKYDRTGGCVEVPGQDAVPRKAQVLTYPVHETNGAIWVWLGDPSKADAAAIPSYPLHDEPHWNWIGSVVHYDANHLLIYDNLLDLSHVGYLHGQTIGGDAEQHSNAQVEVTRTERSVEVVRWLRNSVPPPTYKAMYSFDGLVDRWQVTRFTPGLITLSAGAKKPGTVAHSEDFEGGYSSHSFQAITPETEHSAFYFWSTGIDTRRYGQDALAFKLQQGQHTFEEDRVAIVAQYQRQQESLDRPFVDIQADGPGLAARRIFARLAQAESGRES